MNEGRETSTNVHHLIALDGEEGLIAPHGEGPSSYLLSADVPGDGIIIIRHLKGAETELTDMNGVKGILPTAFTTA